MTGFAIALLTAIAGIIAVLTIADSLLKARAAYEGLMAEQALLRAGFAVQVDPREQRLRAAPRRTMPDRRPVLMRPLPLQACAAA